MQEQLTQLNKLIAQGRYFEAQARATALLQINQENTLKQVYALALSKSGSPEAALEVIEPIYRQLPDDPEVAGILGSIYKELFKKNQSSAFARQARDTYLKNFQATQSYYTGINAAAMSAMVMQSAMCKEIAKQVIDLLSPTTTDFWETVTLAEAYLLTKDKAKTIEYYARAKRMANSDWGKTASVHNQLWLLNHYIPVPNQVMELFTPPRIVAFYGHMIDHPNRKTPRFPAEIEPKIKAAIASQIQALKLQIGYCSLACGGDIIFAETLLEMGGEVHAFIPFDIADFKQVSLRFAGEGWVERFNKLLERVPHTVITTKNYQANDGLFVLLSKVIFGTAVLESNRYHTEPYLLSVLAETDLKRKAGGTRDAIRGLPIAKNKVNINTEDFFTHTVTESIEVTTPEHKIQQEVINVIQYFMMIDTSAMAEFEKHAFEKITASLHGQESITKTSLEAGKEIFAFASETELFISLENILRLIKKFNRWKMVLGIGIENSKELKSESFSVLQQISGLTLPSCVYCSQQVAALLALQGNSFTITHSGFILNETQESQAIYRIGIKENG